MTVYRIRGWNNLYENNRTRELKYLTWVPIPNTHDGDGYTILVDREDGAAYLGAWIACLQVASKCHPRGTLIRHGRSLLRDSRTFPQEAAEPHNSDSLSRITRIPKILFDKLFPILINECKWLEIIDLPEISQLPATIPHETATIPQEGAVNGREGKGIENPPSPQPILALPSTQKNGGTSKTELNPNILDIHNREDLKRVEARMETVRSQATVTASGKSFSQPQLTELSILKSRRQQLLDSLGFKA